MWRRLIPILVVFGCTSSNSNEVDGTINGESYPVAAAISGSILSGAGVPVQARIVLSSSADICRPPGAQVRHPGQRIVTIVLVDDPLMPTAPTAPGTFTVVDSRGRTPPPREKMALFAAFVLDGACEYPDTAAGTTGGTVTLTEVGQDVYRGHFNVAFDSGDHVTGMFSPEPCADLSAAVNSTEIPECKPL